MNAPDDAGDASPGDGVCESILVGGPCTLRAAVQEANALAGHDTIQIPPLTITLTILGTESNALAGALDLTDDLHIEGSGFTTIEAGATEGVFWVQTPSVTISGVSLVGNGQSFGVLMDTYQPNIGVSITTSSFRDFGQCVRNADYRGSLELEDVDFFDCTNAISSSFVPTFLDARNVSIYGGESAISQLGGRSRTRLDNVLINGATGPGTVVTNYGSMHANRLVISNGLGGTAISNQENLILTNSRIVDNESLSWMIYSNGMMSATNVEVSGNETVYQSLANRKSPGIGNLGGRVRLEHVTFRGNHARDAGGGTSVAASISNELGTVELRGTLLDGANACLTGTVTSLGYNTDAGSSCALSATGDLSNTPVTFTTGGFDFSDPQPGPGAIGNGPLDCPPTDARGWARPSGVACDRGAVQVGAFYACQNGLDDDGDGLVDLADPGCSSGTDPLEVDLSPGDILLTSVEGGLLFSVDPVSGRREIIAGGGGIAGPTGVVRSNDGSIYVASYGIAGDPAGPLMRVDPETGEQTLVAWDDTALNNMTGIVELANGHLAVASPGSNQVADVDPVTGLVTTLATGPVGFDPNGIALDPTTGRLFATTPSGSDRLFEIVGGVAVPVALAGGGTVGQPRDIGVDDGQAFISDSGSPDQLRRVDLMTGIVASVATVKTAPRGVDIEADGSVLVADRTANEIVRVDPDTGAQEIFAQGPRIDDAYYIDLVQPPDPCIWTRYGSQARFEAAFPGETEVFDFSSVPLDANGDAGFSNGHDFGPFTWTSLSLASDVDLFPDTTPDGTLWVTNNYGTPPQAYPGGVGAAGTPENDDDFRLDFATGQQAAGIEILDSRVEAGERIEFRDDQDQVIASFELPGDASGVAALPDMAGFVGLAVCPGTPLIKSIVVNEGATVGTPQNDNIGFTNVVTVPEPAGVAGLIAGLLVLLGLDRERRRARRSIHIGGATGGLVAMLVLALAPLYAHALPGEVLSEQKISSTSGGFIGPLADQDEFGYGLAPLGDLDGDGIDDIAVGAWRDGLQNGGAVWTLRLAADGTVKAEQKIDQSHGGFGGTLSIRSFFGASIASLGDLDGDGVMDIAVSAHLDDTHGDNLGAVFILFLNPDGTVKTEQRIDGFDGGFVGVLDPGDEFGHGLSVVGDLDRDGSPELAVGATGDDDGHIAAGAVWILFLLPDGTVHRQQKISATSGGFGGALAAGDGFGVRTAGIGDLDGDGIPDLAISADGDDSDGISSGAVWISFLNQDGTVKSATKLSGFAGPGDSFGEGLAAPGDLNADGLPDLAVGAPLDDDGGLDRGAVWVLALSDSGSATLLQKISATSGSFTGSLDNEDRFGSSVAGLGRFGETTGGGLLVGAIRDDDGGDGRGAVYLLGLDGSGLVCGNAVLDPVEQCDDGNMADFDGCTATCEIEDDLEIFGLAINVGLLSVTIDGVSVNVSVLTGDTPAVVAQLLASAINGTPSLMARGTTAQAVGNAVFTNGTFNMATISAGGMSVSLQPGTVVAQQKISSTEGGFTGILDGLDFFGQGFASLGDLDGDGITDLAAGAGGDDDGVGFNHGAVWILFLNADHTVKSHQKISDTEGMFTGTLDDFDGMGAAIASLGDLDGDGNTDLAVGAGGDDDGGSARGAVWVLFLNSDGNVKAFQKISDTAGGFTGTLDDGDLFGNSVTALGDLDGDGIVDLAVGAVYDDDGGTDRGAVWILFMNEDGTVKGHKKISDTEGGFTGVLDDEDWFGESTAALGDVDGDGTADLAVGADGDDDGDLDHGAVWILFLNSDGSVKSHQKISDTEGLFTGTLDILDGFGVSLAAPGDLDGDGTVDLAVGAQLDDDGGPQRGAVWLLFLKPDGTVKRYAKVGDAQGGFTGILDDVDLFGSSLASLGDQDGDGVVDLVVGATGDDDGGSEHGAVWILSLDGDLAPFCGDALLVAPETCDDGNTSSGDGCYSTCQIEDEIELFGLAQGGSLQVVLSGVSVLIGTSAGQSATTVATNLASVVNITPALQGAGISSVAIGGRVVTNGVFDTAVSMDAGISVPEPGMGLLLVSGLLGLVVLDLLRRRRIASNAPRQVHLVGTRTLREEGRAGSAEDPWNFIRGDRRD